MKIIGKKYLILKKLDDGTISTVYLVKSIKKEEIYAAKVYNTYSKCYFNEIEALNNLSSLNHKNIVHLKEYGEEFIINDGIQEQNKKQYIILDYLPNKDLFYYISYSHEINEKKAKSIFCKIADAVKKCHEKGICHRDLKLENILLNKNNEPILCDFGFAILNNYTNLTEYLGSKHYKSPEIHRKIPYSGIKSDIFSLGVILFTLLFECFGFDQASSDNRLYKLIIRKKYDKYWEEIEKCIGTDKLNMISPEVRKLYLKMVAYSPNERPSIKDILEDESMKNL